MPGWSVRVIIQPTMDGWSVRVILQAHNAWLECEGYTTGTLRLV